MISDKISRRLRGTSAILAGTVIAVVGLAPTMAGAQGGEVGPHGRLIVEKTVDGQTAVTTFGFHVTCDDGMDRDFTIDANSLKDFAAIRTGSVCVVTETDAGGATSTIVNPANGTVVVGDDDPVTVRFVNIFEAPTTTTTTTTIAPLTRPATPPTVLGVSETAPPVSLVLPYELPRTGASSAPALVLAGLVLTVLGFSLRRMAGVRRASAPSAGLQV